MDNVSSLLDKRALITGASRGIGAAIARKLARAGADIAITYQNSTDEAAELVLEIEATGRQAVAIAANAADPAAVENSVRAAVKELGGLDILVNNAGIGRVGTLESMSLSDIQALLDVNIRSAILACRSAIPHLSASGRIINIGSVAADRVPFPGCSIYSLTKASLVGLTRGLARDLAPRGITVNIVHPGATNTDANPSDNPMADQIRSLIPLGRYSEPDDIAAMVAYLAGPDARQITGAAFTVDGGTNA
jgi:NAD(P)-dependent dehydrogenase (short-subunit alcohol dehydrogenase family)